MKKNKDKKAIVMFSGGLDSSLVLKLMVDDGIDVLALHFTSPVHGADSANSMGDAVNSMKELTGCEFKIIRLGDEFLDMVQHPKYGYGKNMNPCIDCRILTLQYARKIMEEEGYSFIVTGEVLGQRPMSQHKQSMLKIEKLSELEGLLLRPLCAKLLETTVPEKEGWVSKDKLLALHGRNRTPQIELAAKLGITKYPPPAGGCLLTDAVFSQKFKDLMDHDIVNTSTVELVKTGRYFRLSPETILVVGRDEKENDNLESLAVSTDTVLMPANDFPGPVGVIRGKCDNEMIDIAGKIVARYTKFSTDTIEITVRKGKEGAGEVIAACKIDDIELEKVLI